MYLTRLFPKASLVLKLSPLFRTHRRETLGTKFALRKAKINKPFPSSPGPLFQNEGRYSAFDMEIVFYSHANKTHFHKKGCAASLILKVRVFGTREWPIHQFHIANNTPLLPSKILQKYCFQFLLERLQCPGEIENKIYVSKFEGGVVNKVYHEQCENSE